MRTKINARMIHKGMLKQLSVFVMCLCMSHQLFAKEVIGKSDGPIIPKSRSYYKVAATCEAATAQVDLDINNVRTTILNGGDMWWNLSNARYEVPKIDDANTVRKHSLFAGAIWIGGLSQGNLKLAAQTYRQSGSDFFPGPLNISTASVSSERCEFYDDIYKVSREEIDDFRNSTDKSNPPLSILDWPGNGDQAFGETPILAPFVNVGGSSLLYEPLLGDYPDVFGDQTLWWVYNDRGNIHSETGGVPIGLELQTQAFGFVTNDEVNNMTFYTTTITNRSSEGVDSTFFGQWVDPDLGNYSDDYVGCDVDRSLGMCYNGDNDDEGILGYGLNPPSVGVDFFEGPADENGNEIPLSRFVYYNNDFSNIGNPTRPEHFYGYLRGFWKDGQPITYGGNGVGGTDVANFMFPGLTDPLGRPLWDEVTAGNTPADRRFIQSVGPFRLLPGATNKLTVGVVWARTSSGGATGSLELLKRASDKAQRLFNNNFEIFDGPSAPDVQITELDRGLVLSLVNTLETENYEDTLIGASGSPVIYKFQGYQIYQLKDATVTTGELDDIERARLIAQVDIEDEVSRLTNEEFDPEVGEPVKKLKVLGENLGIKHTFKIDDDAFATGDKQVINFRRYYYTVIAYASATNDQTDPEQYVAGRLNIKTHVGIPHKPTPRVDGNVVTSTYGDGPAITRIEGQGNGGLALELDEASKAEILENSFMANPTYLGGSGPVNIKVIDPVKVPAAEFEVFIIDTASNDILADTTTTWIMVNKETNDTVYSDATIALENEQIITEVNRGSRKKSVDWGLSVSIAQAIEPGDANNLTDGSNGFLESSITWVNNGQQWLTGLRDADGPGLSNWIRSGNTGRNESFDNQAYQHDFGLNGASLDPREQFENILDRRMAPYRLASYAVQSAGNASTFGPAWDQGRNDTRLSELASIDLVLTPDKSKWTRCVVVELGEDDAVSEGNVPKMHMRDHASWTGEINPDGTPVYDNNDRGRSWFPGYAIDVETGQRLNIMFGEDSFLGRENGNDMIWNPTSNFSDPGGILLGGKHYIYIMGNVPFPQNSPIFQGVTYDGGAAYQDLLRTDANGNLINTNGKRFVYSQAMWVMMSFLSPGFELASLEDGIVPAEVTMRVRVKKPYAKFNTSATPVNEDMPVYTFNTSDIAVQASGDAGKNVMDLVNVVPNPYYGVSTGSGYETNQLDTRVKFTNLPNKCTITIYTLNGTLVRRLRKDDEATFLDWDIKNNAGVPVASGMYIIHVDAGDLGEKTLKWFGVMRPVDLDSF